MLFGRYGIRATVSRTFHRFGCHCANHQIRVILISAVVITSLIYPALALRWTAKPLPHVSAKWLHAVLGNFASPTSTSTTELIDDLNDFWRGFDNLVLNSDSLLRARCSQGPIVRLERLVIFRDTKSEYGALEKDTLLDGLRIQRKINEMLSAEMHNPLLSCLKDINNECLVLSPLSFWNMEESLLNSTSDILDTINQPSGVFTSGIHVTPEMVLSQRSPSSFPNYARFLVLSYFFHDEDCNGNQRHVEWLQVVERLRSPSVSLRHGTEAPTFKALEYNPAPVGTFSVLTACLYLAYIAFFIYFSGSLRKMDTVHSRWGLAFTGLVEIVASTATSISVCAIVNFTVRTVPWSILPVVIVFVGAENMFNLVDAVIKTRITLPVRERIAVGLSQAGTSNTLKVVTYNSILGVIAALSPPGPIREFCAFAIVVLVAHWFLIHTFFVAVLSIDIQRLELSELLSQDASLQPQSVKRLLSDGKEQQEPFISNTLQRWMRGRVARNLSLLLLLAFTALLYYITLPPLEFPSTETVPSSIPPLNKDIDTPAWRVWSILNPFNHNFLHMRVESPSVISLLTTATYPQRRFKKSWLRSTLTQLQPIFWAFKIVVIPIAITTGLVYILLLYLIKNKELLDARHGQSTSGVLQSEALIKEVSFTTLPQLSNMDIYFIAPSEDGSTVVVISMDDEVLIWREKKGITTCFKLDILAPLGISAAFKGVVQAVAIDAAGSWIALGSATDIAVWGLSSKGPIIIFSQAVPAAVTALSFSSSPFAKGTLPPSRNSKSPKTAISACLQDGSTYVWPVEGNSTALTVTSSQRSSCHSAFVSSPGDSETWIVFLTDTGLVELWRCVEGTWKSYTQLQAGNICDTVSRVCLLKTGFSRWMSIAVACVTRAGIITVWDLDSSECFHILEGSYDRVDNMELAPLPGRPCPTCNKIKPDSLALCFSFEDWCNVFHINVEEEAEVFSGCSCSAISSNMDAVPKGLLSRRGSIESPQRKRTQMKDNLAPFPVSGHGVHSRRATGMSEKEVPRPTIEIAAPMDNIFNGESSANLRGLPRNHLLSPVGGAVCRRIASLDVLRGKWTLRNNAIVGVRRKESARSQKSSLDTQGFNETKRHLPPSVLRKWEAFSLDLIEKTLAVSDLQSLISEPQQTAGDPTTSFAEKTYPRLPFTRITCLSNALDFLFLGLGNTPGIIKFKKKSSNGR